jgi:hypothetical protein
MNNLVKILFLYVEYSIHTITNSHAFLFTPCNMVVRDMVQSCMQIYTLFYYYVNCQLITELLIAHGIWFCFHKKGGIKPPLTSFFLGGG